MVFKLVAGVSGRPASIWNMPLPSNEYSLEALNKKNHFRHHYKNRIVQKWNRFKPTEVKDLFISFIRKFIMLIC